MKKKILSSGAKFVRRFFPPIIYSVLSYTISHRKILNFRNPKLFSEKLFWLKYYYRHNLIKKTQLCYDKYTVRDYISSKLSDAEQYLPELYGYYKSVEEIDFKSLPNRFVIKITQGCGDNLFCLDKNQLNYDEAKSKLSRWLEESNKKQFGDESYLYNGDSAIICEEFIADGRLKEINDIRFYCFNGEPKFVSYDINSIGDEGDKKEIYYRNTFDINWCLTDINLGRESRPDIIIEKPKNFKKMLEISRVLSADFPFLRVDQYNIDGDIFIGELTFIPMGGNGVITPKMFEKKLGELLELPDWKFEI